jgi:glycine oxidase
MHFTVEAQRIVAEHLSLGDLAIDATAGNGYDTLFLAEAVGIDGRVFAIDLQGAAIERLKAKLGEHKFLERVDLFVGNHASIEQLVAPKWHGAISCVMFNLGYLPLGDKSITTTRENTVLAVRGAAAVLKPGGMLTVLAYVGHPGGRDEATAVADWMANSGERFECTSLQDFANPNSPILWVAKKRQS